MAETCSETLHGRDHQAGQGADAQQGLGTSGQGPSSQRQEGGGPLFVPVVLSMDPRSHALLLEDWCMRQPVGPASCACHCPCVPSPVVWQADP